MPQETNIHCFLLCWSHSQADLVARCGGGAAAAGRLGEGHPALCVGRRIACGRWLRELRPVCDGPGARRMGGWRFDKWWDGRGAAAVSGDGPVPPSVDKEVAGHMEGLQVLFTQRLEDWSRYMAVYGAARQGM